MIVLKTIVQMVFSPEGFIATAIAFGVLRGIYKGVEKD